MKLITTTGTYILLSTDLTVPNVTITTLPSTSIAGQNFLLTCHVSVVEHLIVKPTVRWSGGSVGLGNGVTQSDTTYSGVMSMRNLTFSPLRTSHGARYLCQANISILSINLMRNTLNSKDVQVQSKRLCSSFMFHNDTQYAQVIFLPSSSDCVAMPTYLHSGSAA